MIVLYLYNQIQIIAQSLNVKGERSVLYWYDVIRFKKDGYWNPYEE